MFRRGFSFFKDALIGGRIQWDTPLSERFAFSSTHQVTIGIRTMVPSYYTFFSPYALYYVSGSVEYGWGVTAILAERISLTFRPANVEIASGTISPFEMNYSLMVGVGTVW